MKKLICILLSLIMLTCTVSAALIGDIDKDGEITVSDALSALRMAAVIDQADETADVDGDGQITVNDALQLLRCSVGFITPDGLAGEPELQFGVSENGASLGLTQEMIDRGIVSAGDPSRIVKVMRKAQAGEDITIGFIGGSVTVGGAATSRELSYARLVHDWWEAAFPDVTVNFVNAGKSGTPSLFAVHRLEQHLMYSEPDLVIIEFGVNDELMAWQQEAYASLVRRILTDDCDPAVLLFFVMNDGGTCAQSDQVPIGEFYDLPMVSYRDAIWPEVEKGTFIWKDICADWVHPTDIGHAICAELINTYFETVYQNLSKLSAEVSPVPEDVPLPYSYKNAVWYNKNNTTPISMGSFEVSPNYDHSWRAVGDSSDPLVLRYYGKRLILHVNQMHTDKANAYISIDGKPQVQLSKDNLLISSGAYGYYMLMDELEPGWHTIEITRVSNDLEVSGLFASWE